MYCLTRCRYHTHQCGAKKLPRVIWGSTCSTKEICETSGLQIPMVPRLHHCNGYMKRNLRAWRVQKCIALVGADIALTSVGPQTTPCHGGQYMVHQGNMRNFGPTNTHGTASAPMQWLYQKEATGMESSKMYCPSRCRHRTHQCGAANYHLSFQAVQSPLRKYTKFGPTNTHGTASAPMQWLNQMEATGMESSKMYCPSQCRYRTHQCGTANYPVSWGEVQGPPRKYGKLRAYQYPWYRVCTNAMVIPKGRYGHGEFKNVLP